MTRKTHHVVPNSYGEWDVKKGGGERAIKHFDKEARCCRLWSKCKQESEFIVHKKDGAIQNPDSHGGDPIPPRDKK